MVEKMGLYKICFRDGVFESYDELEKKERKKVFSILKDIARNGYESGYAHAEPLRGNWSGFFSKTVDKKNRVVFIIEEDRAEIIAVETHYGDK
ncbi:MAG: type II toxin-antitoxin system YoeB family toxin [Ruminococcus sp.]|jgi:toxin YoeB|nr:type II toxin-antitoxin system YoeB family toxin [Ruminococcus sp.]